MYCIQLLISVEDLRAAQSQRGLLTLSKPLSAEPCNQDWNVYENAHDIDD